MKEFFTGLKDTFILNFVEDNRWRYVTGGIKTTLLITLCSVIIGILLGMIVATVRSTYDKNREAYEKRGGFGVFILKIINGICKLYLTVIRGTPIVVQLLIMY